MKSNTNPHRSAGRPAGVPERLAKRRSTGLNPDTLEKIRQTLKSGGSFRTLGKELHADRSVIVRRLHEEGYDVEMCWNFYIEAIPDFQYVRSAAHPQSPAELLEILSLQTIQIDLPETDHEQFISAMQSKAFWPGSPMEFPAEPKSGMTVGQLIDVNTAAMALHRGANTIARIIGVSTPIITKRLAHMGLRLVNRREYRLVPIPKETPTPLSDGMPGKY